MQRSILGRTPAWGYQQRQLRIPPLVHLFHVDSITMNTPTISKGGTTSWGIAVKDANGLAVSGIPVTVWLLNPSWNGIDYSATVDTDNSGVASFSTNATSATGTYFMLLPYVDTSLTSYYYDSYQNKAWTTYFTAQ